MITIGEKINGAIPSMVKTIVNKDVEYIQNVAKLQIKVGTDFIDVCPFAKKLRFLNSEGTKLDDAFTAFAREKDWEVVALLNDDTSIPKTAEKAFSSI